MAVFHDEKWAIPGAVMANALQSRLDTNEIEGKFNHVNGNVLQTSVKTFRAQISILQRGFRD